MNYSDVVKPAQEGGIDMTLQDAINKYHAANQALKSAKKELEAATEYLIANAPYKVGDKVLISYQNGTLLGFVTEISISSYKDADNNLFWFVVRQPTKKGLYSDRTRVITYAKPKDLQLNN